MPDNLPAVRATLPDQERLQSKLNDLMWVFSIDIVFPNRIDIRGEIKPPVGLAVPREASNLYAWFASRYTDVLGEVARFGLRHYSSPTMTFTCTIVDSTQGSQKLINHRAEVWLTLMT